MDREDVLYKDVVRLYEEVKVLKATIVQRDEEIQKLKEELAERPAKE